VFSVDIQFHRHNRLDIALVKNHPLALVFLPAADIPRFVAEGNVHLGITGQDQVAEFKAHDDQAGEINEVLALGFGKCSLQVQVPETGPIGDARQLIGKRVVTSFTGLTRAYFERLEREMGVKQGGTQIKYVGGSVEAACALGVADGIVDLVGRSPLQDVLTRGRIWRDDEGCWIKGYGYCHGNASRSHLLIHLWLTNTIKPWTRPSNPHH
jgi:ATP phosphoribosyltransferase